MQIRENPNDKLVHNEQNHRGFVLGFEREDGSRYEVVLLEHDQMKAFLLGEGRDPESFYKQIDT